MADNQEEKIIERFTAIRKALKMTQKNFAEQLGYKQGHISEMENGSKNIAKAIFYPLESILNVNVEWLKTGEGTMFQEGGMKISPRLEAKPMRLYADPLEYDNKKQKFIHLPDGSIAMRVSIVPARAYAGYMRGFADPEYYDDLDDILIGVDAEANGTYIGFEVVGDSMICLESVELAEESIFPGRIAIGRDLPSELWKTRLHTHNYRNWVFVHKTEGILIKQIANHDIENGIVTIHSLNPKYPDEDLKLEDMQQIFSVIQVVQRTRPKLK